jgi:hypothetical protein
LPTDLGGRHSAAQTTRFYTAAEQDHAGDAADFETLGNRGQSFANGRDISRPTEAKYDNSMTILRLF